MLDGPCSNRGRDPDLASDPHLPITGNVTGSASPPFGRVLRVLPGLAPVRIIGAALLVIGTPASAQRPAPAAPTPYQRAVAAGYKAAMLCSGMFNAGRSRAEVEAHELRGIYPEYDSLGSKLGAAIDRPSGTVLVDAQVPGLPPRMAIWRRGRGCTNLPIGAAGEQLGDAVPLVAGADPRRWPMGDAGIAPVPSPALAGTVAAAFDRSTYGAGETTGIVVLQGGSIVAERYAPGWGPFVSNRTWSVGKSIAGTLVGVAISQGGPRPQAPASIAAWRRTGDPRGAITLDQLLRMGSGLHSDTAGNRTDAIYFGGAAVDQDATHWLLEAKPGARFRYANNDILLAVLSLRESLGEVRYDRLAPDLFVALGMRHTVAERDWAGNYVLSSQVWSTARDLARLGQFWLQDGVWQGKRLLPEGWVRYMTTPSGPQPESGPGYGATLWLFGPAQGLPAGSYAAQGNRGQYVIVIPSRRLVIVRRGEDPGGARFDIARFAADVAASVR